ncbi:MAG TPA: oligosaccharide flippase family protein [Bacteroidales bacterium]|jgi:O-antigen/teichoic acid export membrane protein|nr:oligosaccharide flippase family protein [Bacteroidales bacterium]HQK69227.1 oligosaccharide flippase family protein [Bacteroidales bacterium]
MLYKILQKYQSNEKVKQVAGLLSANVISIPLSVVTSIIVTRFLGPSDYGSFKFILNLFTLAVVIFTFGFFQAGNRALVLNNDPQKARELYGAELIITGLLFLFLAISFCGYAFFDKNINEKGLRFVLLLTLPFSWVFLISKYFEVLFQADNRIRLLAKSRLFPHLIYFVIILIIHYTLANYSGNRLILILAAYYFGNVVVAVYVMMKINPSFNNLKDRIQEIIHYNKEYGFNVYLGSLFAVGFSQLTGVLISYFASDNSGVGYYSLAVTIAGPLAFIPNVIATTHYKDFSKSSKVSKRLLNITLAISLMALLGAVVLVGPFVRIFYGSEFAPVIKLTYIVSFGILLNGLGDFFNRFLGSHGEGKALRNSAFIVGISVMIFNVILIPMYGEYGAALTTFISGLIYFVCMYFYYRRLISALPSVK